MNRLDRYIIRTVLALTGLVALGLVTIYTLVVFISDIGETGKGSYGVLQVVQYSLLMMPSSRVTSSRQTRTDSASAAPSFSAASCAGTNGLGSAISPRITPIFLMISDSP